MNTNINTNTSPPSYDNTNALTQSSTGPIYTMSYLHLSSLRDSIDTDADPTPLYPQLQQPIASTSPPQPSHLSAPQPGQYYTVTTRSEHYQPPPPQPDLPPLYSHVMQSRAPSALSTQYQQYLSHYQHNQALLHTQALDEHVKALQREAKFRKFQQEQIEEMRRIELAHEARKRQLSADKRPTEHADRDKAKELAIRCSETQLTDFKREAQQLIDAYHKCDTKSTPLWQLTAFTVTAAEDRLATLYSSRGHFDANHPSLHSDWLVLSDDESRIVTLPQDDNAGLAQSIRVMEDNKNTQFATALQSNTSVARLRALALAVGVPHQHRAEIWARLLGVVGSDPAQWHKQLTQRRDEYVALVHSLSAALSPESVVQLQMIAVDVPRTHPQGWGLLFRYVRDPLTFDPVHRPHTTSICSVTR
jgi:predicted GIY-YIG superfamily endonuclease